jgi:hypothetical protein
MYRVIFTVLITFFVGLSSLPALNHGLSSEGTVSIAVTSTPAAQAAFEYSLKIPCLRPRNVQGLWKPLTRDNNFTLNLRADVSPVSTNGIVNFVVTPLAVLEVNAGLQVGTGWDILGFKSGMSGGLGVVRRDNGRINWEPIGRFGDQPTFNVSSKDLRGVMLRCFAGLTLQFDLAAVLPGDWNHLVFRTVQQFEYYKNTIAADNEYWNYETNLDYWTRQGLGKALNRFNYYSSYAIGYMTPTLPWFRMAAIQAELNIASPLWADAPDSTRMPALTIDILLEFALGRVDKKLGVRRHTLALAFCFDSIATYTLGDNVYATPKHNQPVFHFGDGGGGSFTRAALLYTYRLW